MQHRIAQLADNRMNVNTLPALLPAVLPLGPSQAEADLQKGAVPERHEQAAAEGAYFPWPDNGMPDGPMARWPDARRPAVRGTHGRHTGRSRVKHVSRPARAAHPLCTPTA